MKFIDSGKLDFEKIKALKYNNNFGNFIITTTEMAFFEFYTEALLSGGIQSEDFYLQKINYISATNSYEYYDYLQLNNTYKQTGYFESYEFASEVDEGMYRLRAGNYYSIDLIQAVIKDITGVINGFIHGDANDDYWGDDNDDYWGEPL